MKLDAFSIALKIRHFCKYRRYLHNAVLNWSDSVIKISRNEVKIVEEYWHEKISRPVEPENPNAPKKYILSMFPYPSGNLHMGHVRVYTIADCIARYYTLKGHEVFQPMGWDAFGLPAENAAIERKENPKEWTLKNIDVMRDQLKSLGCQFNWKNEVATCNPDYYKWTQWIFVQMFKQGLAYRKKSFVNWDPVDKTVLASEQIDSSGKSWRSGALAEKRLLNQWHLKTTKFTKDLYDNLDKLQDWKGVASEQRNWLGDCRFYKFSLDLHYPSDNKTIEQQQQNEQQIYRKSNDFVEIGLENPSDLANGKFLLVSKSDDLARMVLQNDSTEKLENDFIGLKNVRAKNPISGEMMPIVIAATAENDPELFFEFETCKLGIPNKNEKHKMIFERAFKNCEEFFAREEECSNVVDSDFVVNKAKKEGWGGHISSHRLKDWCVSRQRYWGTPIPIVYCRNCGTVPVPESELPVELPNMDPEHFKSSYHPQSPEKSENGHQISSPLSAFKEWVRCKCPKCGQAGAERETDTLDTFFDSSFYYVRYLDHKNGQQLCDPKFSQKWMPVDVYVGGKEHAVLHLYFARFACHFLHRLGLSPVQEPFARLLPQGVVMAPAYCLKSTGQYVPLDRVEKQGIKWIDKLTKEELEERCEKMSKSKFNGIDPKAVLAEHGSSITRLLMMGFVSPQAPMKNWNVQGGLKGMHRWINRIIYLVQNYIEQRSKCDPDSEPFAPDEPLEKSLKDLYNISVQKVSFRNETTFILNGAVDDLIILTSALRRQPLDVYAKSLEFERCLHSLIIMCYPLMPHLAAEFWSALKRVPARSAVYNNDKDIWQQKWPELDADAKVKLVFLDTNNEEYIDFTLISRDQIEQLTLKEAIELASKRSVDFRRFKSKFSIENYELAPFENNSGSGLVLKIKTNGEKTAGKSQGAMINNEEITEEKEEERQDVSQEDEQGVDKSKSSRKNRKRKFSHSN